MTRYLKNDVIRGAGGGGKSGGGGSQRAPVESPDSLRSIQYAKILDLISEGEIGGLVDGLKSVFLNDTPIQNADGTYNFSNVIMDERVGTQSQSYMAGFDGAEAETTVGTEVKQSVSVTRTLTSLNSSAVRVTIGIPQMTQQDVSTGDLNGSSVEIAIDVQNNGGGFTPAFLRKIFSAGNFNLTAAGASTGIAGTDFNVVVNWVGQMVQAPQTCTFQLQYRQIGNVPWLTYATYTFSGGSVVNSGIGSIGIGSGIGSSIVNTPAGSKTFSVTLASALYEFRLVKTNGSVQQDSGGFLGGGATLVGTAYGGLVSIAGGSILQPVNTDVISGKTTSRYQRAYRIDLPAPGPWDIKVRRITADSLTTSLQNRTFWDSLTEIVDAKLSYPNSAYVGLKVDSQQFNAIPSRGFECYLLLIQVPSNYNPLTRVYSGVWDGTFQVAWSDNPAWVFYDMVISERYGLGQFIDASQVDKWALYAIAQYCDEMVDDGFGGLEPRFTCNLYLQTREQAFTVIANIASVFRGIAWWSAGALTAAQDAPASVSQLFSAANVVGGEFNYSGSSGKVRHTVALVGWNDPQDAYRQKIEYVEDAAGIARYGVIQSDVVATGCTSRGQAHRVGRWLIYSEQNETETVTFRAGLDAVYCGPGDIIQTSDAIRAGSRFGGRLLAANASQVQLDAPFTLVPATGYSLSCILPDGSVETHAITTPAATTDIINIDVPFSVAPQVMSMWVISSTVLVPESWRVVSMAEVNKTQLDITALAYRPKKYAAVEQNMILQPLPVSLIEANQPDSPSALVFSEALYLSGLSVVAVKGTVSWQTVPGATYSLTYQRAQQNAITIDGIQHNSTDIQPMLEGQYSLSVVAVNALGRRSQPASINITVYGKTLPPVDVMGLSITKSSGVALASWALHPDLDVQVGGNIVIRHSLLTSGATWQDGVILDAFAGSATSGLLPLITGTYMVKALDSSGNWSVNMMSFIATEGLVTGFNTVASSIQQSAFSGAKTNIANTSSAIQLAGNTLIDDMLTNIDDWSVIDSLGGIVADGIYAFDAVMDLGSILTRRFETDIKAVSFDVGDFVDSRMADIDDWGAFDGDIINDCDATLYAAITNDDPSASPVWSAWTPFFVSDFTCRALKFQLELASANQNHNIAVSTLRVDAKVPV